MRFFTPESPLREIEKKPKDDKKAAQGVVRLVAKCVTRYQKKTCGNAMQPIIAVTMLVHSGCRVNVVRAPSPGLVILKSHDSGLGNGPGHPYSPLSQSDGHLRGRRQVGFLVSLVAARRGRSDLSQARMARKIRLAQLCTMCFRRRRGA